ncbi:YtzC family protein, partial [Bacillus sp. 'calajunan']|uniref:YtzC family protein n=1 Tax=Bacillus sp. 'calajunan' TaxID=3447457 RepID=UPI003EE0950C
MAERQSLESYIRQAEQAVEYAKEQVDQGMRQEHYNTMEYSDAQLQLEQAYNDLQTMQKHANDEQREQLNRARMAIRHLQHLSLKDYRCCRRL